MPASVPSPYQALYRFNPLLSSFCLTLWPASLTAEQACFDKAAVKTWEKPTRKKLGYKGGAKYFIPPSIALCDCVVYAVNRGDKPMGHWLLAVPALWQKKKNILSALKCIGPPGKCPVCPITNPALNTMDQHQQMTLHPKSSQTLETEHWTSSKLGYDLLHPSSRL